MNTCNPRAPRTPAHKPLPRSELQSPPSDYHSEFTTSTTRSPDPIMLLSQRWQCVASQITRARLQRDTVVALNRNLDEAENILLWRAPKVVQQKKEAFGLGIMIDSDGKDQMDGVGEATPPASAEPDAPAFAEDGSRKRLDDEATSALMGRLSKAVDQLRQRQEEFRHLHNVAIAKAEEGAERILQLESDADQLEADVMDDQCELSYLKLKLRIIEIQTLPYVPSREKDQLAEGIQRWKLDWADVDKRFHARRRKKRPRAIVDWQRQSAERTI